MHKRDLSIGLLMMPWMVSGMDSFRVGNAKPDRNSLLLFRGEGFAS